ncbi:hypothetical protein GCK72_003325 [Caenorhabditis remanei]|uniref:Uncharacterized protein n=1 Tax=Caenorhabditis remanei TaxID=31234 RepID=A0A6A5HU68_CAERE|nr:hypothetical protein GCK72_003325 [Caenorhabditis remanei]KAF1771498.1 hypothetical protein GCK72_003325 [Caenorhabditis remanei]
MVSIVVPAVILFTFSINTPPDFYSAAALQWNDNAMDGCAHADRLRGLLTQNVSLATFAVSKVEVELTDMLFNCDARKNETELERMKSFEVLYYNMFYTFFGPLTDMFDNFLFDKN